MADWVTKREASSMLKMSERTIDRMAKDGKLKRKILLVAGKGPLPHFGRREIDTIRKTEMGLSEPGTALVRSETAVAINHEADGRQEKPSALEHLAALLGSTRKLPPSELKCKLFLTPAEAVEYTGLSLGYLDMLFRDGKITRVIGMRPFRYRREDLDRL